MLSIYYKNAGNVVYTCPAQNTIDDALPLSWAGIQHDKRYINAGYAGASPIPITNLNTINASEPPIEQTNFEKKILSYVYEWSIESSMKSLAGELHTSLQYDRCK